MLQESLRFDVACNERVPEPPPGEPPSCATPFTNRAAPNRYPFNQLRGNCSTTAIAISDLWSGVPSTEGPQRLLSVPLLWDYAHAAGLENMTWAVYPGGTNEASLVTPEKTCCCDDCRVSDAGGDP